MYRRISKAFYLLNNGNIKEHVMFRSKPTEGSVRVGICRALAFTSK